MSKILVVDDEQRGEEAVAEVLENLNRQKVKNLIIFGLMRANDDEVFSQKKLEKKNLCYIF